MQQFGGTEKRIGLVSTKAAPAPTYAAPDHDWFLRRQQQRQRWEQQQLDQQQQCDQQQNFAPVPTQAYGQQKSAQYMTPVHPGAQSTSCSASDPTDAMSTSHAQRPHSMQGGRESQELNTPVSVGGLCSLSTQMEVRSGNNNDYATRRRSPPPASSPSFIHGVSNRSCTKSSSPLSKWPHSGPQYEKLEIDVSLDHAPDFDTSSWNRNGVILIPVDTLSAESEYHDSEIRAIMYNSETGASFPLTSNYCMNANDLRDHWTVLEEEYPRIEAYNMFFPLLFKSNKYFLPVFKEAGSDTRF
jgi:hypothetical protein